MERTDARVGPSPLIICRAILSVIVTIGELIGQLMSGQVGQRLIAIRKFSSAV